MTDRSADTTVARGTASRTDVDIATGVLVGRCGTSVTEAVNQLFATARDNRISLFELSRTVIPLAEGKDGRDPFTRRIALEQWGAVLSPQQLGATSVSENPVSA